MPKLLSGPGRALLFGGGIVYLFRDDFTVADAAPLTDPLPADVLGSWDVDLDTANNLDVAGGVLQLNGSVSNADPRLTGSASFARANGLALLFRVLQPGAADLDTRVGWDDASSGTVIGSGGFEFRTGFAFKMWPVNISDVTLTDDVNYDCAVILRAAGIYWFIKGGSQYPSWTLLFVNDTDADDPVWLGLSPSTVGTRGLDFDTARVTQLPSGKIPRPVVSDDFSLIPTIADSGSNGLDATPVRVGLSGSEASFDGETAYVDHYSAALNTAFDGQEFTDIVRFKVPSDVVWEDGTLDYVARSLVDASNRFSFRLDAATNSLSWVYIAGGTTKSITKGSLTTTSFQTMGMTASLSSGGSGEMKAVYNGSQESATQTGLGTWAGDFDSNQVVLAAASVTPSNNAKITVSDRILSLNGAIATVAQHSTIHTELAADTLTTADLDTIFGAGNYLWLKLNEQYTSDGLGHLEADGNGSGVIQQGGTWSNAGSKAFNAPLGGDEVILTGDFALDQDWDKGTGWTIAAGIGSKAAGVGSDLGQTVDPLGAGNWYTLTYTTSGRTAGTLTPKFGTEAGVARSTNATFTETQIANAVAFDLTADSSFDGDVDNVSVQQLALVDLLRLASTSYTDVILRDDLTITDEFQAGLTARWDSQSSPANGIIVYFDRGNTEQIVVGKYVAGTYSEVSATAATYSAGAKLEVRCIGTEVRVFYNNAHVVTDTVSDAGITSNTLHGLFGTENVSTHEDLEAWPVDAINYDQYFIGA